MAAPALVHLQGGSPEQMVHACAMAVKNLLGLVCDPVGGLVEVPCVKRNVIGAMDARRQQIYHALFRAEDGRVTRLTQDCAISLEELASQLGFQGEAAETFLATVARYNELCEKGQDEDFGKAAEKMHPLTTGPFRAITYDTLKHTSVDDVSCMRLLVTMGGLVTDDCARVLDDASSPIPGLYAGGNTVGYRFGASYETLLHGGSNGLAATHAYVAGEQAALA